jgi:drug/metabolite transporter (DMT)-like permease
MSTIVLYTVVVFIWGSAWLAVKFQVGVVPVEVSVAYRIGIAALCMFSWAAIKGWRLRFPLVHHRYLALQGAMIFSCNFIFFYLAATHLTTGLIAVLFSTASALTILINAFLQRRWPEAKVVFGATLGVIGIAIVFHPELAAFRLDSGAGRGLMQTLAGTLCFCFGSILAGRNHRAGLPLCGATAWAMFYGLVLLITFAGLRGSPWIFEWTLAYGASLFYLAIFGSVIAFAAYFLLLARIEAEKAAYSTVLFPAVALSLSTLFEGYRWTWSAICGILLIFIGNILVLQRGRSAIDRN